MRRSPGQLGPGRKRRGQWHAQERRTTGSLRVLPPASSIGRLVAAMQLAAPQVKSTSPPRSTRLRPKRSDKPP